MRWSDNQRQTSDVNYRRTPDRRPGYLGIELPDSHHPTGTDREDVRTVAGEGSDRQTEFSVRTALTPIRGLWGRGPHGLAGVGGEGPTQSAPPASPSAPGH